jgi:hypothetical protein
LIGWPGFLDFARAAIEKPGDGVNERALMIANQERRQWASPTFET